MPAEDIWYLILHVALLATALAVGWILRGWEIAALSMLEKHRIAARELATPRHE